MRKVCPNCAYKVDPPASIAETADRAGISLDKVTKAKGCDSCNGAGYRGRAGVYEVLVPDDEMRDAIASGAKLGKLRQLARQSGMRTLYEYGLDMVNQGVTSVDELLRVTCE